MENKSEMEKKIEGTLNSINHIDRASMPPYFFTRLEARMQKEKSVWEKLTFFLSNPVLAFGSICLILFLNIYVITFSPNEELKMSQQNTEFASVDEYTQLSSGIFEFENFKP